MNMINRIEIVGTVGNSRLSSFEDRQTVNFSVVTNYVYKSRDNIPVFETMWFNVSAWEGKGISHEAIGEIQKGSDVRVLGRLREREYTASDGSIRHITEVVASNVEILDPKEFMQPAK